MKYFFLLLGVVLFFGCGSNRHLKKFEAWNEIAPPGTIRFNDTLWVDETEITNSQWREYVYWLSRIHSNSEVAKRALPDTSVWNKNKNNMAFQPPEYYYRHPQFNKYPVVGISQEQAQLFSEWRSDRVFERLLISKGVIEFSPNQTEKDYSSIERYIQNEINGQETDALIKWYPEFSLPNSNLASFAFEPDTTTYYSYGRGKNKKKEKTRNVYTTDSEIYATIQGSGKRQDTTVTKYFTGVSFVFNGLRNNGLYEIIGNAREWSSTPNVTYGGCWKNTYDEIMANDTTHVFEPDAMTGFRNVCVWRRVEDHPAFVGYGEQK